MQSLRNKERPKSSTPNRATAMDAIAALPTITSTPSLIRKQSPLLILSYSTSTTTTPPPPRLRATRQSLLRAQGRGFGAALASDKKLRREEDEKEEVIKRSGDQDEDAISEAVFNRMLRRIVVAVGAPMASGVALLFVLSVLKERQLWAAPGWLPFLSALLAFGTSALGIAYGSLSTSWDPKREGSLLGLEEVEKNWPLVWQDDENERRS